MKDDETLFINGNFIAVERILTDNKNASAKLKDSKVVLKLPKRWSEHERMRVASNLLKRSVKAIETGRWQGEQNCEIELQDGQILCALNTEYKLNLSTGAKFQSRLDGNTIAIVRNENHPQKAKITKIIVMERIIESIGNEILKRIDRINSFYFGSKLGRVKIKDMKTRWGSCSPDHSLVLNFKLLFMPDEILDYVIAHELAHTKYRNHGKKFWTLVEKAVPDHKEKRRWLRQHGMKHYRQRMSINLQ